MSLNKIYINCRFLSQKLTGVQRYSYEIIKLLDSCTLIIPDKIQDCYDLKEISQHNFIKLKLTRNYIWDHVTVPKVVPKGKVLWSPMGTGSLFCKNQVITIHDLAPLENNGFYSKKFTLYYKFLYKRIAKRCLKILTVSEYTKSRVIDLFGTPQKDIQVSYPGVSGLFVDGVTGDERKNVDSKPFGVERFNINKPYFLCVASLSKRKNIQRLMEAWLNLDDSSRDKFELIFAGSGIDERVFNLNQDVFGREFRFLKNVTDIELISLYKQAYAFIYPSLYEGFGLPIVEAMQCGAPVITSNITSMPEVAGKNNAIFVDPYDVSSIKDGILKLINDNDLTCLFSKRGMVRAKEFDYKKTVKIISEVFSVL